MLQRSPRRARMLAVPAALLLALAACGDDDDDETGGDDTEATATADATESTDASDGTEPTDSATSGTASGETYESDDYVDALVGEIGGDDEGSECVARAVVDAIGTDRLEASGVSPEDLANSSDLEQLGLQIDTANAPALQSDLEACPDLVELFGEAADISDEELDCVRQNVTQANVAELLVVQFTGGEVSQELLSAQEAAQACSEN